MTGEPNLGRLMQTDISAFWTLAPNLDKVQVTEILANSDNTPSTYTYSTNEMGFRSPPLKPTGTRFRILAMGDSTTFGQHLADDETWPAQLQHLLDPEAERVEVINAGVIGASSFQGLVFLNTRGLALKPDLVVATYGFNDWGTTEASDREKGWAYQNRDLVGFLKAALDGISSTRGGRLVQRATPGEYLDNMLALVRLCEERDIPVLLIIWPKPYDEDDPGDNPLSYMVLLHEVCRITTAQCLDLTPIFRAATEPVFLDRVHATTVGNGLVAEAIRSLLAKWQIIPSESLREE